MADIPQLRASAALPQRVPDTGPALQRSGSYGEAVSDQLCALDARHCEEGTEYVFTSPTPGTGIAQIAAPNAFITTSPFLIISNNNPIGSNINIRPKYIRLANTVAGTNGTNMNYVLVLDNTLRWSSAGTAIVPVSPNFLATRNTDALVYAGALVAAAASTAVRLLDHGPLRTSIVVVGDTFNFTFGGVDKTPTSLAKNGTTPSDFVIPQSAVSIAPGGSLLLYIWAASQSVAGNFEVGGAYVER
jgi:hypothetical protein